MAGRSRKREEIYVYPKLMPLGVSSSHGKRNNITQNDLIRVAKENDISNYKEIIQQTGNSLQEFHKEAEKYDIPEPISRAIEKKLKELDISPKMNFSI